MRTTDALVAALACTLLSAAPRCRADDGWLGNGGTDAHLGRHPTVRMLDETVRMTILDDDVHVDCRFVFQNDGPACSVRMGFPVYDTNDERYDQKRSAFNAFASQVDGRWVKTELVQRPHNGLWYAKTVSFPAHGRRIVRDIYTVDPGVVQQVGVTERVVVLRGRNRSVVRQSTVIEAGYVFHTGATWRGRIGRAELLVDFQTRAVRPPIVALRPDHEWRRRDWSNHTDRVYYDGPCAPVVKDRTLRFVRSDWRPTRDDDVYLLYGCSRQPDWVEPDATDPATSVSPYHTPQPGDPERKAILAAVRASLYARDSSLQTRGGGLIFRVRLIGVYEDWAFLRAEPRSLDGAWRAPDVDVLLRRSGETWRVIDTVGKRDDTLAKLRLRNRQAPQSLFPRE